MESLPFGLPGRFYRGNVHTHSTNSDGRYTPQEVVALYRDHGYDFVSITDHHMPQFDYTITDTSDLRCKEFTTIIGAELHVPGMQYGEMWHLLGVGLPLDFAAPSATETAPELAARAAAAGAFVGIAHPAWYNMTLDEARSIEAAHAVEVFNHVCVLLNDRGDSWYLADQLLAEGRRVSAFGTDDAHFNERFPEAFRCWVMVKAERLEPELLLEALKAGHYYTSQGPYIHDVRIDEARETLSVRTSPAASIFVSGTSWSATNMHGYALTEASFPLERFNGTHCRITVVDAWGRKAWSNPIWLS